MSKENENADAVEGTEVPDKVQSLLAASVIKLFQFITNTLVLMYVLGTVAMIYPFAFTFTFVKCAVLYLSYGALTFDTKTAAALTNTMNTSPKANTMYVTMVFFKPLCIFAVFFLLRLVL